MIGKTVSHYQLLEKLGEGAMGVVYKARDLKLDRFVAIKFITQNRDVDSQRKSRFIREAKAASALDHVNICTIYEIGETEGNTDDAQLFIVMAYYPGQTLRARLDRGSLPLAESVRIAMQIAEGLAKAHSIGVVHRDIKPVNIMLTRDGIPKIVDFGLAKLPQLERLTSTGAILGTMPYMSPEQLKSSPVDHRTDIWSWGVTTYEMLAGERPFSGDSELSLAEAILTSEPATLTDLHP